MFPERRVKLFKNGRNQAVRIPRGFELPGNGRRNAQGGRLNSSWMAVYPKSLLVSP